MSNWGDDSVDPASGLLGRDLEQLTRTLFDIAGEGILVADPEGNVVAYNKAFAAVSGRNHNELIGNALDDLFANAANTQGSYDDLWKVLKEGGKWEGEVWLRDKDGRLHAQWATVAMVGKPEEPDHYVAVFTEPHMKDGERAKRDANFDSLTGLPSRSLFIDRLAQSVATARRVKDKVALLFINLDGFKLINDTLGHSAGDIVLQETARRLLECIRDNDTVARFAGDEFTMLLMNPDKAMSTTIVAQRVIDALNMPFIIDEEEVFLSGSIGITLFPDDGEDTGILLKNADVAMGRAKSEGQASYRFFTDDMNAEAGERLTIKNALAKALERNEFHLFYQPKIDVETGIIKSAESLMRWNSETLGFVPPGRFIPVMEDAGMIREVGDWALYDACKTTRRFMDAGFPDISIAVNLSARQLHHPAICDTVEAAMKEAGIGSKNLELEITESMLMTDPDKTAEILHKFRSMGISLALDDFGTGYSSLSYLKRFPIDTIKIDRSFVMDITKDPDDAEIVRAIINMGRVLDRKIVAEGVEYEEEYQMLADYKCHLIQGYLISKPVPADDFLVLLDAYKNGRPAPAPANG